MYSFRNRRVRSRYSYPNIRRRYFAVPEFIRRQQAIRARQEPRSLVGLSYRRVQRLIRSQTHSY